jgi:putative transposase
MPEYRRNRVPGGTYFFTVNLANRRSDLLVREIGTLRAAGKAVSHRRLGYSAGPHALHLDPA